MADRVQMVQLPIETRRSTRIVIDYCLTTQKICYNHSLVKMYRKYNQILEKIQDSVVPISMKETKRIMEPLIKQL